MITLVKFQFSSEGLSPLEVLDIVLPLGFRPVVGDYDYAIEYEEHEEYMRLLPRLHEALKGSGVRYELTTEE